MQKSHTILRPFNRDDPQTVEGKGTFNNFEFMQKEDKLPS
jgi:hypothetical protein